jgi:cyanophycin synthetase
MSEYTPFYKSLWEDAARRVGCGFEELMPGYWRVTAGDRTSVIHNYKVGIDDPVTLHLAGNKPLCYRLMGEEGLSIPAYLSFRLNDLEAVRRFMEKEGGLFVVKPAVGTAGSRGVTTHVAGFSECRKASALASLFSPDILIEKHIPGESYRLLVLDGRVIHAARRRGIRVTGDGIRSVRGLLEGAAGGGNDVGAFWEREVTSHLALRGYTLDSIPGDGEEILVASRNGVSRKHVEVLTSYDEDVTGQIGDDLRDQAVRAAKVIGSRFAGVDIITGDPSAPLKRNGGAIHEINTTPALHNHYNLPGGPENGTPAAVFVIRYLLGISKL